MIIKALGENEIIEPDISKIKLNENEENRFFICSDGVSNLISTTELEEVLIIKDLEEIKNKIIKLVKLRGAADDYSFIIVETTK